MGAESLLRKKSFTRRRLESKKGAERRKLLVPLRLEVSGYQVQGPGAFGGEDFEKVVAAFTLNAETLKH